MLCQEHWTAPTYPLTPDKTPIPPAYTIAHPPATLYFLPLSQLDLKGFICPCSGVACHDPPTQGGFWGASDALCQHCHLPSPGHPSPPALGSRAWYLLVHERVPSQEALLPAQQDPIPSLGLSPAAGLRHLVATCSQQSEHGCKPEVFGPVDATAAKLEGDQREIWWVGAEPRGGVVVQRWTAAPKARRGAGSSLS